VKTIRTLSVLLLLIALGTLTSESSFAATRKKRRNVHHIPVPAAPATRPMVLPFIHDDYSRALAEARARKIPIFIESWAPW
jgi:hypothetical protein